MIERKILIGLITNTDFCRKMSEIWDVKLLESETAKRMALWCWEYFLKYDQAPGRDIENIFYQKIKAINFPKDIAEEIEQEILPDLSEEYEKQDINLNYLINEAEAYFNERHLFIHQETISNLLAAGKSQEAEKLALEFKPLSTTAHKLSDYILSIHQIRLIKRPKPPLLIKPWLRTGQTAVIYGNFGSGKSLLTLTIAYLLGLKDYDREECEIGEWQVKNPTGCLYIDGELGEQEMEERVKKFEWLGPQNPKFRMRVLSIPEYQMATEDPFYLSIRTNQLKIIQWLRDHENYKLLVLDSASTLFGLEDENNNSEWSNKVNPFLRDLRAIGVACLLLHHSGKDIKRGLRGASAIGAMANYIFKLSDHPDKDIDSGKAWFNLKKDKQRSGGYSFKAFGLRFDQNDDETETHWEVTRMD